MREDQDSGEWDITELPTGVSAVWKPVQPVVHRDADTFVRRPAAYVAGPMVGSGDPYENIGTAFRLATALERAGWTTFIPHANAFWAMAGAPYSGGKWLDYDLQWVARCQAVVRLPGASPGGDREEAFARARGIPVFTLPTWWEGGFSDAFPVDDHLVPHPLEEAEDFNKRVIMAGGDF